MLNKKLKAFTMIELLVSMALVAMLAAFSFTGYNQIHKLYKNYTIQSKFVNDINQLNKALFFISNQCSSVYAIDDKLIFKNDSLETTLTCNNLMMILSFKTHSDSFFVTSKNRQVKYVKISAFDSLNLVQSFKADVSFQNQIFHVSFQKDYDCNHLLYSTLDLFPLNE